MWCGASVGQGVAVWERRCEVSVVLRVLAVAAFLLLFFAGTYFARVANPPHPLLGYSFGALAFIVGGALWRGGARP